MILILLLIAVLLIPSPAQAGSATAVTSTQTIEHVANDALGHRDPLFATDNEGRRIEVEHNNSNNTRIIRIERNGHRTVLVSRVQLGNNLPVFALSWHEDALFIAHGHVVSMWHNDGRFHTILSNLPINEEYYTNRFAFRDGRVYVVTVYPINQQPGYSNWWSNYWPSNYQNQYPIQQTQCQTIDFIDPYYSRGNARLASLDSPYPVTVDAPRYTYSNSSRCGGSVITTEIPRDDRRYDIREVDYARKRAESQYDAERCDFYRTWYNDASFC